jgi:hypothetical protein
MTPVGRLAKIGRSVLPAMVTDGSRGKDLAFSITPNVWHALMIATDEAASIKRARSAIMHLYRCFA